MAWNDSSKSEIEICPSLNVYSLLFITAATQNCCVLYTFLKLSSFTRTNQCIDFYISNRINTRLCEKYLPIRHEICVEILLFIDVGKKPCRCYKCVCTRGDVMCLSWLSFDVNACVQKMLSQTGAMHQSGFIVLCN